MALKLSQLKNKTKTVPIFVGTEDEFTITYRLDFYTVAVEELINELTREENKKPLSSNIDIVSDIIIDWDLVDDNGKKTSPTKEILLGFGTKTISAIMKEIMTESVPNEQIPNSQLDI